MQINLFPEGLDNRYIDHMSDNAFALYNSDNALTFGDAKPMLLTGGGFDTLANIVGWLALAVQHRTTGRTLPLAEGLCITYGQSVTHSETTVARAQWSFLNTALAAINAADPDTVDAGGIKFEWTPYGAYPWEEDARAQMHVVHDSLLAAFLQETQHPITWNHIVPQTPLPDHSGVASRNIRFLQTAQLYATRSGSNTVIFGAQGSGPDVSPEFLESAFNTLWRGNDERTFSIYAPLTGMLKSVGLGAAHEAGLHDVIPLLGYSCQSENGATPASADQPSVQKHCGVCFRCTINKLNFKRAWLEYNLVDLEPVDVAHRLEPAA